MSLHFTLDSYLDVVLLLLVAVALIGLAWLSIARPWRSNGLSAGDRVRISSALIRYEFWLELRGVNRRRRRDLIEELRGNLHDATAQIGSGPAVAALGPVRLMSAEAAGPARGRPHWSAGIVAATTLFLVVTVLELVATAAWVSAADTAGVDRLQGALPLFPGSRASWERLDGGLSVALEPGWLVVAAVVVGFVVAARPWLGLTRRAAP
jgi:hypothetical protein